ncbi:hypothetical protein AVEN_51833-1 [Araneus ventricosus]|uniref:Uncharacterized protein n=1 Tax=Araneus ventricosus TaxID=182803 RepID=A0A4Y2KEX7_ARAVE|nr:hypothetical protein AVEN_51833-1 [Araneus ventricosus]
MDQSSLSPTQHYISFATDGSGKQHQENRILVTESSIRNSFSYVGLTVDAEDLLLPKWPEKYGVDAFSQNEIEHFECCDDDVITSGEVSEEDIVALVNEKNNSIVDSSSDMEEVQDEPESSIADAKTAANVLSNFFLSQKTSTNMLWTCLK